MFRILLLVLLLTPFVGHADSIYRTTDAQGNVVFTDAPPAEEAGTSEQVTLQPMNTVEPPDPATAPIPAPEAAEPLPLTVTITEPANETSYPMGPGNFSASARVQPNMPPGASLQLLVDGTPWGSPQRGTTWQLTNVFRGAHDLTVALIDGKGETIAMSEPVRVYVHRPSIIFRNRPN